MDRTDALMFPLPVRIQRRRYWREGDLHNFDVGVAKCSGTEPPPEPKDPNAYRSAAQVRARYGDVSNMTIWRWLQQSTKQAA